MTYKEIAAREPRIAAVIGKIKPTGAMRLRYRQYETAKIELVPFAGWYAADPDLRTAQAYESVVRELAQRLRI